MKDLEKLQQTLSGIGTKFEVKTAKEEYGNEIHTSSYDGITTFDMVLIIDQGIGYPSFRCEFYFLEGKFVNHGCWE